MNNTAVNLSILAIVMICICVLWSLILWAVARSYGVRLAAEGRLPEQVLDRMQKQEDARTRELYLAIADSLELDPSHAALIAKNLRAAADRTRQG